MLKALGADIGFHFQTKALFFFQERATIFNGPLALQSEVTVVLISFDGEQIY